MRCVGFNVGEENEDKAQKIAFVNAFEDPYMEHLDRPITMSLSGGVGYIGIYRGLQNNGNYRLQPSIITEFNTLDGAGKFEGSAVRIEDRPTLVNSRAMVQAVIPMSEEYFDSLEGPESRRIFSGMERRI